MQVIGTQRGAWRRCFPNPGYYGWTIVGVGLLCSALSSPGQSFALAFYLDALIEATGLSRLELSSLYAGVTLLAAACLPLVGAVADRVPARAFLVGVLALLAGAMLLLAGVRGAAGLAIAWFLLRLLGQGAIGIGTLTIATRWFHAFRGRALAIVSLGYAVGELVFPVILFTLIASFGWRGSLATLGVVYLLVFVPLVALLSRERRATDGALDGFPITHPEARYRLPSPSVHEPAAGVRGALRTGAFWCALFCISLPSLYLSGVIFHQVALFESLGWGITLVPVAMAAFAGAAAIGTYAAGVALERIPCRWGVVISLLLAVIGFGSVALPLPPGAAAVLYGSLLGLASGVGIATDAVLWPAYFGIHAAGAIRGVVTAVRNGAAAAGPPLAALLFGASGSFASTLLVFGGIAASGCMIAAWLRPPNVQQRAGAEPQLAPAASAMS